jgi:hypothetical protein
MAKNGHLIAVIAIGSEPTPDENARIMGRCKHLRIPPVLAQEMDFTVLAKFLAIRPSQACLSHIDVAFVCQAPIIEMPNRIALPLQEHPWIEAGRYQMTSIVEKQILGVGLLPHSEHGIVDLLLPINLALHCSHVTLHFVAIQSIEEHRTPAWQLYSGFGWVEEVSQFVPRCRPHVML